MIRKPLSLGSQLLFLPCLDILQIERLSLNFVTFCLDSRMFITFFLFGISPNFFFELFIFNKFFMLLLTLTFLFQFICLSLSSQYACTLRGGEKSSAMQSLSQLETLPSQGFASNSSSSLVMLDGMTKFV